MLKHTEYRKKAGQYQRGTVWFGFIDKTVLSTAAFFACT